MFFDVIPKTKTPLKLPAGEKSGELKAENVTGLEREFYERKLDGCIIVKHPSSNIEGRVLLKEGYIIAASFENKSENITHLGEAALQNILAQYSPLTEAYEFDETDIWLAVNMNKEKLFKYDASSVERENNSVNKETAPISRKDVMAKYRLKDVTEDYADEIIKLAINS
jgi:hypothetical protein